jgi:hypothetical protein
LTLPSIPLFLAFPTVGPDGPGLSNIDGRAAALEVYLGAHALRGDDGTPCPVIWKGQVGGVYQGELRDKNAVQSRFEESVEAVRTGRQSAASFDFAGVHAIFAALFEAMAARS